jgi:hypothetical protein
MIASLTNRYYQIRGLMKVVNKMHRVTGTNLAFNFQKMTSGSITDKTVKLKKMYYLKLRNLECDLEETLLFEKVIDLVSQSPLKKLKIQFT